jgi:zinc protease
MRRRFQVHRATLPPGSPRGSTAARRALAALLLLGVGAPPAPARAQVQRPAVAEFTVAGIPVVHMPIAANDVIAVQLYLKGGSANLTPERAGIENFLALAARRGTQKYSRDEFAALAAATGTAIGHNANPDYTSFSVQAIREHWDGAWDLFTQAVRYPTFPDAEVELVRGQIVNQLRGRADNPDAYLAVLANNLLYAGHPYALDPLGTVETVGAITAADLRRWHAERLTKENLLMVVVGNVSREDIARKVQDAFGGLPAAGGTVRPVPAVSTTAAKVEVAERELPTNYIRGQFTAPDPSHADYPAFRVAMDILSNRLFEEVRTKRNLSYAVQAGLSQRRSNYGLLYVTAVEPDTTIKVMLAEVERLKTEPITGARLAQSVNGFLTEYWLAQETNMGQAGTLGTYELVGGGWENAEAFTRRVRAVTPADIQRVSRQYLRNVHFAVIGNPARIDRALFTSY